jgi:hypothetical protein
MPNARTVYVALALLPFTLAFDGTRRTRLVHAPAEGARLVHAFTLDAAFEPARIELRHGTRAAETDALEAGLGRLVRGGEWRVEGAWTDAVTKASVAGPLAFERTFGDLLVDGAQALEANERAERLRFERADAGSPFTVACVAPTEPSEDQQEFARRLRALVDHAEFLPTSAVEDGATWAVALDVDGWNAALVPWLSRAATAGIGQELAGDALAAQVDRSLVARAFESVAGHAAANEIECSFHGVRRDPESGRMLAEVRLAFDETLTFDASDAYGAWRATPDANTDTNPSRRHVGSVSAHLVGDGELLWDVEGGHLARFDLLLEVELSANAADVVAIFDEGFVQALGASVTWSGTLHARHTVADE